MSGSLILVATPIGNLGDFSPRAQEALSQADRILCEDTRRTRILLSAFSIPAKGRLEAFHDHNETERIARILEFLHSGELIALVSDAGTPAISDPGERLVAAAVAEGLRVTTVPGPSALLAALVVSGFSTDRFVMEGFLPRKGAERATRLEHVRKEERTSVFYESPKRLGATLADFVAVLGPQRHVCIARELTKLHEELWRGSVEEALAQFSDTEVRGEVVLVVEGATPRDTPEASDAQLMAALEAARSSGLSARDAAREVAELFDVPRRRVYELGVQGSNES
jgi:16S rRNA (cytidine1402-2'-O)-methyltransferase